MLMVLHGNDGVHTHNRGSKDILCVVAPNMSLLPLLCVCTPSLPCRTINIMSPNEIEKQETRINLYRY